MKRTNPLLGRTVDAVTPIRTGGVTGRIGEFGWTRRDPTGAPKQHKGLDLLAPEAWPVFAAHAGVVERAGWENDDDPNQGYGQRVWLAGAGIRSVYAHLSKILVAVGASVAEGALIGLVGRTGNIAGSKGIPTHLHFEVHLNGTVTDPHEWLTGEASA